MGYQELVQESPQPQAPPTESPPAARVPLVLPALLCAGLLWLSFFPADAGWLAWIALAPLLVLVRSRARPWRIYAAAWLAGLVLYFASIHWLRHADDRIFVGTIVMGHLTWSGLAIYCSFYFPLLIFLTRSLDQTIRLPLAITLPAAWTALEFVRSHLMTGFPWYFLAHTQHSFLPLIQISDLGGAYLVSFLVAAVNALAFEWICSMHGFREWLGLMPPRFAIVLKRQTAIIALCVVAALVYGFCRLGQENFRAGPRVALIQGNMPQSLRNLAGSSSEQRQAASASSDRHFNDLAEQAAKDHPDLIVWPETSAPFAWDVASDDQATDYTLEKLRDLAHLNTNLLLGTNSYNQEADDPEHWVPYNSAILVRPGANPWVGRYDKIHRVPFGEYVPLKEELPFMKLFAPYEFDYSIRPGPRCTRFPLGEYHFGVLICFEDTDTYLARHYVESQTAPFDGLARFVAGGMYNHLPPTEGGAAKVDFFLNLSNDAWFAGSSEHDQHLASCRFRAVECRRAIARAVNMGISAVIDGSGRVVALPGENWEASKKISAVVTAAIPIDDRGSLYVRLGDWLPALCMLIVVGGFVWGLFRPCECGVKG